MAYELVVVSAGSPQTVRYHVLIPLLLNELQVAKREIRDLKARFEAGSTPASAAGH